MPRITVVYASTHGQTAKIVTHVARRLEGRGYVVTSWPVEEFPATASVGDADLILIAGSVYFGRHQRSLVDFVRRRVAELESIPSAFLSVCGALGGAWDQGEDEARKYVSGFMKATGWYPAVARSVAGAVKYTAYRLPIRWVMKFISARTGRPTDTSRDWELTDWRAVDRFADELHGLVTPVPAGTTA